MLHVVLPEGSKYGKHSTVACEVMTWAQWRMSTDKEMFYRVGTGNSKLSSISQLEGDVWDNDAIALSDEFSQGELTEVAEKYPYVPLLIITDGAPNVPQGPQVGPSKWAHKVLAYGHERTLSAQSIAGWVPF